MWLLERNTFDAMERAAIAGMVPTAEQQAQFEARSFGDESSGPRLLNIVGNNAEIIISGVITKSPDFLAMLFGGGNTTYADINAALDAAEQNEAVDNITLKMDSPGGQFDGLFDTIAKLQAVTKPLKTVVSGVAASAAFAIGVQGETFTATNRADRIGSVGVVGVFRIDSDKVSVSSTAAPRKRPDPTTEEGRAIIRLEIDAMHQLFAEAIATGRGTTVENVNANFGQGATLLADQAVKFGMIDGIADRPLRAVKPAIPVGEPQTKGKAMDLKTLQAEHPAVYAEAVQIGAQQATAKERDRVGAFVVAGEQSGDMATALEAIKDGSEMTQTLSTKFLMAATNRGSIEARGADDGAAAAALDNVAAEAVEAATTANASALAGAFELCGCEMEVK